MLRADPDGSIRLTIKGATIARLDHITAASITSQALVEWENSMRFEHYERSNGFYSRKNQHEAREAEISEWRFRAYPSVVVQSEVDHNAYWSERRELAVDN